MKGYGQHHYQSSWLLVILLILGGIFGGWIGQALSSLYHLAFLNLGLNVGLPVTYTEPGLPEPHFWLHFQGKSCHYPWFYCRSYYLSALVRVVACAGDYPGFVFAAAGGAFETPGRFF